MTERRVLKVAEVTPAQRRVILALLALAGEPARPAPAPKARKAAA